MASTSTALPYAVTNFVDRDIEIGLVIDRLDSLRGGSLPQKRTIAFVGERGIGKSWLLQHLYNLVQNEKYKKDVKPCWLDLATFNSDPILAVLDILKKIRGYFTENETASGTTPAESSRRLLEEVREYLKGHFLILFVDHVYEADWNLLAGLEDYLLGPLAIEPHTIIVLSGRGRAYPWKTPELRLEAVFQNMQPLNEKDSEEQLRRQIPEAVSRVGDIVAATGGNPLGNYILGKEGDPQKGLDDVIKSTLEIVPDQEREQIRAYLEALSVLRSFDEERIPLMLAAYFKKEDYKKWGYADSRQVRDDLVKFAFARWDETKSGFILDEMLRKSLEHYLQIATPKIWQRLEEAALEIYDLWSKNYPRSGEFWMKEAAYHKEILVTTLAL